MKHDFEEILNFDLGFGSIYLLSLKNLQKFLLFL